MAPCCQIGGLVKTDCLHGGWREASPSHHEDAGPTGSHPKTPAAFSLGPPAPAHPCIPHHVTSGQFLLLFHLSVQMSLLQGNCSLASPSSRLDPIRACLSASPCAVLFRQSAQLVLTSWVDFLKHICLHPLHCNLQGRKGCASGSPPLTLHPQPGTWPTGGTQIHMDLRGSAQSAINCRTPSPAFAGNTQVPLPSFTLDAL